MNNLNSNSIALIKDKINHEINLLKEEKNQLIKEKRDNSIKISQNDINDNYNNNDNNFNEIEIKKEENNKIRELQNYLIERITRVEMEIKKYKDFIMKNRINKSGRNIQI